MPEYQAMSDGSASSNPSTSSHQVSGVGERPALSTLDELAIMAAQDGGGAHR